MPSKVIRKQPHTKSWVYQLTEIASIWRA